MAERYFNNWVLRPRYLKYFKNEKFWAHQNIFTRIKTFEPRWAEAHPTLNATTIVEFLRRVDRHAWHT